MNEEAFTNLQEAERELSRQRDEAKQQLAAVTSDRDFQKREAEGYQRIAKEAADAEEPGLLVLLVSQAGTELRIFGPDKDRESAFGETLARWFKLVNVVAESMKSKDLEKKLAAVTTELGQAKEIIRLLEESEGKLAEERDELRQALTGRTVSCSTCNGESRIREAAVDFLRAKDIAAEAFGMPNHDQVLIEEELAEMHLRELLGKSEPQPPWTFMVDITPGKLPKREPRFAFLGEPQPPAPEPETAPSIVKCARCEETERALAKHCASILRTQSMCMSDQSERWRTIRHGAIAEKGRLLIHGLWRNPHPPDPEPPFPGAVLDEEKL
jgi:hypothetical protein